MPFSSHLLPSRQRHEPRASASLQPESILPHSTTALFKKEREIAGYDALPQRVTAGDDGAGEQPHWSDGDGCGKAISDGSGSEGTSIPIQAVSGAFRCRQRKGFNFL